MQGFTRQLYCNRRGYYFEQHQISVREKQTEKRKSFAETLPEGSLFSEQ
jgi:hypothetical protein